MPGVDFAAAIREGNRDNGLGISQSRGGRNQVVKDTSDITGGENKGENLFLPAEIDVDEEPERTSFIEVLWKSKWLILILVLMTVYIYRENLEHIRMHNAL